MEQIYQTIQIENEQLVKALAFVEKQLEMAVGKQSINYHDLFYSSLIHTRHHSISHITITVEKEQVNAMYLDFKQHYDVQQRDS